MKLRIKSIIWNIRRQKKNNNQSEQEKRIPKNEDSVSSPWDNFKKPNICIIGMPEGKRKSEKLEIYLKK